jgi:hypothetical protein
MPAGDPPQLKELTGDLSRLTGVMQIRRLTDESVAVASDTHYVILAAETDGDYPYLEMSTYSTVQEWMVDLGIVSQQAYTQFVEGIQRKQAALRRQNRNLRILGQLRKSVFEAVKAMNARMTEQELRTFIDGKLE